MGESYQLGRILPQSVFATRTGESVINPEFMTNFYIVISIGESFIKSQSSILPPGRPGTPCQFYPRGGGPPVNFRKIRKNTLKIRTICLIFLHRAFSNASSNHLHDRIHSHTTHWFHLFDFSPLCDFKCIIKELALEDA